jgi:hypothetical protein
MAGNASQRKEEPAYDLLKNSFRIEPRMKHGSGTFVEASVFHPWLSSFGSLEIEKLLFVRSLLTLGF